MQVKDEIAGDGFRRGQCPQGNGFRRNPFEAPPIVSLRRGAGGQEGVRRVLAEIAIEIKRIMGMIGAVLPVDASRDMIIPDEPPSSS